MPSCGVTTKVVLKQGLHCMGIGTIKNMGQWIFLHVEKGLQDQLIANMGLMG